MKLINALLNVDKSDKNTNSWVDPEPLANAFSLCSYDLDTDLFNKGIVGYWVRSWICTDTEVGIMAIYLFNELVGYSEQTARKGDTNIKFVSSVQAKKTHEFMLSCLTSDTFAEVAADDVLNREIGETYQVDVGTQIIYKDTKRAAVYNRPVIFVQGVTKSRYFDSVEVLFTDTNEKGIVHVNEYKIPYRVIEL